MWSLESRYCCYVFVDRALILSIREGHVRVAGSCKGTQRRLEGAKLDDDIRILADW